MEFSIDFFRKLDELIGGGEVVDVGERVYYLPFHCAKL